MSEIKWHHWGKKAFQRARDLDRPILLDISAVWCHWCHIMDQTTYSNEEIARLIEEVVVPIRVDRDQRPDLDKRYNMGGWPTTVFLTPNGEVITGGTYVPPDKMKSLLFTVRRFYRGNKNNIAAKAKMLRKPKTTHPLFETVPNETDFELVIDDLVLEVLSVFDPVHGGFGEAPKFPHSDALAFSLLEYHLRGEKSLLNVVSKTLLKMGDGNMYDRFEGGFFRYSTTRDWRVPHYEKLCEDNARLLVNYLEAFQVMGEEMFQETARGILAFVSDTLSNRQNGGFYGSQDADEEYYKQDPTKRKTKKAPSVDKTIYTNWNAMMISAHFLASAVLREPLYHDFALKSINLLLEKSFDPKNGMYHFYLAGKRQIPGLLMDQVQMVRCLTDAYQFTSETRFLIYAATITDFMIKNLWDNAGGFYDRLKDPRALGALKTLSKPFDENSIASYALLQLYHLTGKEIYLEFARRNLECHFQNYKQYGITAAPYGLTVEFYLHPVRIHIVGSPEDPLTCQFREESLRAYNPLKVTQVLDPAVDIERLKEWNYPNDGTPKAYVCQKGTCKLVEDPQDIHKKII